MSKTVTSIRDEKRKAGLAAKALHDAELVEYGEPRPDGTRATRPRSVGQTYDIPPIDGTYCPDKVDQAGADLVDLNRVMARFEKTGQLAELIALGMGSDNGAYDDFTAAPDFQAALDIVNKGNEQFALLSAKIRQRFNGDPVEFMAFVSDPKNIDEMETLGLLSPQAVAARKAARGDTSGVSNPPASPPATPPASPVPAGGQPASTN